LRAKGAEPKRNKSAWVRRSLDMARTPILIIDDEPAVVESLREFLEDEGYEVHGAMGAREGLDLFLRLHPALLMTDLRMPEMSGMELIAEVRKRNKSVPIIIFTGYGSFNNAVEAIRLDVFDFITKPMDLDYLRQTLNQAREMVQTTREIRNGMSILHDQIALLQSEWRGRQDKLVQLEPFIQTGKLLSSILQDLSNPLTCIMGEAKLLRVLHPQVKSLKGIQDQVLRMQEIIAASLKRVKSLHTREPEWLQLNDLLRDEVLIMETDQHFRLNVVKEWDLDAELPLIRGGVAQLAQVFGNILANAVDSMKGRPESKLLIKTRGNGSAVYASIGDTGTGMSERIKDRIFEPFFSTKPPEDAINGGHDDRIGLYRCKEVIQQYGGYIEVRSEPESGATFIVHLPAARRS
jgi:signal transduction histidine kinase